MSQPGDNTVVFEGEDGNAGYASPALDLIATAFLLALSVAVLIASIRLPVPGGLSTAPGLLPFLTAGSLGIMAMVLGYSAIARRRKGVAMWEDTGRSRSQDVRSGILVGAVAIYIACLQGLAFQYFMTVSGVPFVISAFEPVTIVALAAIIHIFWRGPLWITSVVSIGWTLSLSLVFQKVFNIPLPGGF
jgi:hypothetical protein